MPPEDAAKMVEKLHDELLFGHDDWQAGLDVIAEQEVLQAIEFLRLAQRAFMKAHYHQLRAVVASPYRGWNQT